MLCSSFFVIVAEWIVNEGKESSQTEKKKYVPPFFLIPFSAFQTNTKIFNHAEINVFEATQPNSEVNVNHQTTGSQPRIYKDSKGKTQLLLLPQWC